MSYFDDQFEAWKEKGFEGNPEDLEGDEVAEILIQKAERDQKSTSGQGGEE